MGVCKEGIAEEKTTMTSLAEEEHACAGNEIREGSVDAMMPLSDVTREEDTERHGDTALTFSYPTNN